MKYKTKLDSSILISHKKVRTAEVHVVGKSIDTCVESISNPNMKDYGGMASCEIALIHEHDFSVVAGKKKSFVCCLTCGVYFCGLCGKVLVDVQIHTDQLCFGVQKQKRPIQTIRELN